MTFRDLIDLSAGNLWRKKLRAILTVSGVIIAIATLVAMLSFAAGNHKYVTEGYSELGLLTRMTVFPRTGHSDTDSTEAARLDNSAIDLLSAIPGVKLVYPYVDLEVTAALADTQFTTQARVLSGDALKTQMYSTILSGVSFSTEDAREAIVTRDFVNLAGITHADSLVGKQLIISTKAASLDSALAGVFGGPGIRFNGPMADIDPDSLSDPGYRSRALQRELNARARSFFDGLMKHQMRIADTLTIVAVAPEVENYQIRTAPIVIPEATARRLTSAGIGLGGDPTELLAAMQTGELFRPGGAADSKTYPRVTMELQATASITAVKDSVEALGFQGFSLAEQFDEVQKFFVYYYLGLSVIGLIALLTASLGIVNTMIMSITERRKEIGILKALGADEREIRLIFLAESGAIGFVGSAAGILIGWLGTRVFAVIAKVVMQRIEMPIFDPFTLPVWLIFVALAFGILVSLLAGAYPSGRAARVDPVEALRGE
jgi:ABC-type antimicrobial peptide transport system permease subunit